ncbi:MAG: DNA translocase FtsK [Deltaproteobacteria bacterium]|nr:DNA translocase FtsK [Deltaproteobacteria bacterium]
MVFLVLAAWLAGSLAGFHPTDPTPLVDDPGPAQNFLGLPGAFTAYVAYQALGLAAWGLVVFLAGAGWLFWRARGELPLVIFGGGALWCLVALVAALGLVGGGFKGGAVPLGGGMGASLGEVFREHLGLVAAWGLTGVVLLAGLGLMIWAAWAALEPLLNPPDTTREDDPYAEDGDWLEGDAARPAAAAAPAEPVTPASPGGPPPAEPVADLALAPALDIALEPPGLEPPGWEPPGRESPGVETAAPAAPEPEPGPPPLRIKRPEPGPAASVLPEEPTAAAAARPPLEVSPLPAGQFQLPPLEVLRPGDPPATAEQEEDFRRVAAKLKEKLADFGVKGEVVEVAPGPVVTMYEFKPAPGVKISKVSGLSDDLAMNLKAPSIRIVAPIPGKAVIGIEIPNKQREVVYLRDLLGSPAYTQAKSPLTIALGKNILGRPVVQDMTRMPHLLIAGATGSGKSVFINTLVLSILYKATPREVRLLMVDPKRIELSTYNDVPHLLHPIITSPKEATAGLRWALLEMERRYDLLAQAGVRNIASFNQKVLAGEAPTPPGLDFGPPETLPYILIIIDELADLMMVSSKEVEALITRLAQMARAAGIHLVLATQRPSVDVITGLIKANFPARISFQVTSRVDSRTILDQQGAENLLGNGDMLFLHASTMGLTRLHGALVSDREIEDVVDYWKAQASPDYDASIVETSGEENGANGGNGEEEDELYPEAVKVVVDSGQASISYVQRRLKVGYNRAARMIEQMEKEGVVGPSEGSRPREVLLKP